VIAESIALLVVALPVLGPGAYLVHRAWDRGGAARAAACVVLAAAGALVVWLLSPLGPGDTLPERIEGFAGAWGVLFMVAGIAVIGVGIVAGVRRRRRKGTDHTGR
jgi:hypothetical protein